MLLDNLSLIDDVEYSFVFFVSGDSGVEVKENNSNIWYRFECFVFLINLYEFFFFVNMLIM